MRLDFKILTKITLVYRKLSSEGCLLRLSFQG